MPERLLTINMRKFLINQPRTKRAKKAAGYVRDRVAHYTKIKPENIKIGYDLNNLIFKEYAKSMRPLKLRVKIGTDTADVLPFKEGAAAEPEKAKETQKKSILERKQPAKEEPKAARAPTPAKQPQQKPTQPKQPQQKPTEQK